MRSAVVVGLQDACLAALGLKQGAQIAAEHEKALQLARNDSN